MLDQVTARDPNATEGMLHSGRSEPRAATVNELNVTQTASASASVSVRPAWQAIWIRLRSAAFFMRSVDFAARYYPEPIQRAPKARCEPAAEQNNKQEAYSLREESCCDGVLPTV